jgi:integrase
MAIRANRKTRKLNPGVYARPDGKYQAHISIPDDVRFAYGRLKLVLSLKTDDPDQANSRHAELVAQYNAGFDLIRRGTASKAFEAFALRLHTSQAEVIRDGADRTLHAGGTNHYLSPTWRKLLDSDNPEELGATVGWAADWFYAEQLGLDPDALPKELKSSRAYRQVLRECAEVLKDSWRAGREAEEGRTISLPLYPALKAKADESVDGNRALDDRATWPLLRYYDEVYCHAKVGEIARTSLKNKRQSIDLFVALVGNPPLFLTTRSQVGDFQEALKYLPDGRRLKGELAEKSLREIVALQRAGTLKLPRLGATTIDKHVQNIKSLLSHAHKKGHVRMNPALGIEGVKPTEDNAKTERRPFTRVEIEAIFRQPMFAGCATDSDRGLYQPGNLKIRDARFWIPVLLFLTGARASEVAGLEKSDVKVGDGAVRIVFQYSPLRRLKGPESARVIPLHPWALKMGFAEYVASLPDDTPYLFPSVVKEARGKSGEITEASVSGISIFRQFNRTLLSKVGLGDDPGTSLHSFRHTLEDAMTGRDIPEEVMFRLTGRAIGGSRRIYTKSLPHGEDARDLRAKEYLRHVKRIDFGGVDISHLFKHKS